MSVGIEVPTDVAVVRGNNLPIDEERVRDPRAHGSISQLLG